MTGKKLLVADDSLTIQKVIRLALSNEGYDIQAVSDGNDAIQQIAVFRPDVVLIDVSLPGQSASEVKKATEQMQDAPDVRFVLMSSAFEKVDEQQITAMKFHGRLTKPFDPAHLRQTITGVLAQKSATAAANLPPPLPVEEEAEPSVGDAWNDPLTPLGTEPLKDLWEKESPSAGPAPFEPPPLPEPPKESDDIQNLTASTIRMSGLDDFQWSVNEPSLKPPSAMTDHGGATLRIEPPTSLPPFELEPPVPASVGSEPPRFTPPPQPGDSLTSDASYSFSDAKLEEMMRKELEARIEQLAQKLLPEVAERVIKAEIHRLLSEQP